MRLNLPFIATLLALLPTLSICAQTPGSATAHFAKNGLEFDYPAAWKMTEGGAGQSEYAEVASEGKAVQLIVNWQFTAVLECQVEPSRKQILRTLADRIAIQIHTGTPPETAWQKTRYGEVPVEFVQLHGFINNSLVTADAVSLLVKNYVINLVYFRGDNDAQATTAWEAIRTSLKIDRSVPVATPEPGGGGVSKAGTIDGGVLNGKAIRLPKPPYPAKASAAGVSGTVVVQVLIDESGNVIDACPTSGDPLLLEVAAAAARQSKFSPTKLSGKPVRTIGIIQYNFGPR